MPNDLSPMMQQYREIAARYSDCILFFRLGDFYEMFFEDAKLVSRELELTLTGRDCGGGERAPMCGVPFHSYEGYAARLVKRGYKIAICEQLEDPALAKGLVKRDVIRVITPGTVLDGALLEEDQNNYLCAVYNDTDAVGLGFVDVSTGQMTCTQLALTPTNAASQQRQLQTELYRFKPRELLVEAGDAGEAAAFARERLSALITETPQNAVTRENAPGIVLEAFGRGSLGEMGLANRLAACAACAMLLQYLSRTQRDVVGRLNGCEWYSGDRYMSLDPTTIRNLELTETMFGGERAGSLLAVLDKTRTAMGKRLLRATVERPLVDFNRILRRQEAVAELFGESMLRADLMDLLRGILDLERLTTKLHCRGGGPRDMVAMAAGIRRLAPIKELLGQLTKSSLLLALNGRIDPLEDVAERVESAIADDPAINTADGGVIRAGFDSKVDELRDLEQHARDYLAAMETEERDKTGIRSLRIVYNRVFGYSIEVTRSNASLVPERYIRKQTLASSERYVTPELKTLEDRLMSARDQLIAREAVLYEETRLFISERRERISETAAAVAQVDVLAALAQVSQSCGYCRPVLSLDRRLHITDGRHPVIERMLDGAPFVANDTAMDGEDNRVMILTGPNMAGKSTYMRQTALIVLLAQLGCFVPARSAEIGLCDAIFTRVGASDDLSSGRSTFMVEMTEVAHILRGATADSLVLLDEIGRGTSTYDGMSIARAVIEYISDKKKIGARTLFATHYHELTALEGELSGVRNYNIAAIKRANTLTFLRKVVRGGADESYGIEVAKLAGVPDAVVRRAGAILKQLESDKPTEQTKRAAREASPQLAFVSEREQTLVDLLSRVEIEKVTPIEALNKLYELVKLAKQ